MSARESLIGAGLAVVLVVGIVDAAAGHDDSSKPASTSAPATSAPDTPAPQASTPPTIEPTPIPTVSPSRTHHRGGGGGTSLATPTSMASSAAPTESATPTAVATPTKSADTVPSGVLGTFSYTTTGSEGTNIPGTDRDFPKTTKIVNKLDGCGISSTWKPIDEHVQKQVLCPGGDGVKIKSYETTISFYGVSSGESFACSGPSYLYRESVAAGDTWHFKCKSADATATQTSTAVGFETINVGGSAVKALHVHVDTTLHGDSSGTSTQDYWIATKKPVLVKETGKVVANQKNVHYTSTYSLALKSLSPKT